MKQRLMAPKNSHNNNISNNSNSKLYSENLNVHATRQPLQINSSERCCPLLHGFSCRTPFYASIEEISNHFSSFRLEPSFSLSSGIRSAPVTPATPISSVEFEKAKKEFQEHFLQKIHKDQLTRAKGMIKPVSSLPTCITGSVSDEEAHDDVNFFEREPGFIDNARETSNIVVSENSCHSTISIPLNTRPMSSLSPEGLISEKQHQAQDQTPNDQNLMDNILSEYVKQRSKHMPSRKVKIHKTSKTKTSLLERRKKKASISIQIDFNPIK
jgi:hypothetical protein